MRRFRCGEEVRIDGVVIRNCRQLQGRAGTGLLRNERARGILVLHRLVSGDTIRKWIRQLNVLAPLRRLCADFGAVRNQVLRIVRIKAGELG